MPVAAAPGPWSLGIDLGGTKIHAELFDTDARRRWQARVPTPAGDYGATLAALVGLVDDARRVAGSAGLQVGVGGPGALAADGRVKNANSTCLNGQPLVEDLSARLGQPVRYANDANCLALSEAVDGAGAGHRVVFAVILGTGTGAGIAVDGRLLEGPNRLAGEWGHNPLPWLDDEERRIALAEPCWCGRPGCIESFVSGPALARDHRRRGGRQPTARAIAEDAARGDAGCIATLDRHAHRLARALIGVVHVLDPDVIVLAGGLSLMTGLVDRVQGQWTPWVFGARPGEPLRTVLVTARHGDASGVRGAAWLWRS